LTVLSQREVHGIYYLPLASIGGSTVIIDCSVSYLHVLGSFCFLFTRPLCSERNYRAPSIRTCDF